MNNAPTTAPAPDATYDQYRKQVAAINRLAKPSNRIRPLTRTAWERTYGSESR